MSEFDDEEKTPEEQIAFLNDMLNWHAALLAVLLEEAGGVVEVKSEDLYAIDLASAKATITQDEDRGVFIIERMVFDAAK